MQVPHYEATCRQHFVVLSGHEILTTLEVLLDIRSCERRHLESLTELVMPVSSRKRMKNVMNT